MWEKCGGGGRSLGGEGKCFSDASFAYGGGAAAAVRNSGLPDRKNNRM